MSLDNRGSVWGAVIRGFAIGVLMLALWFLIWPAEAQVQMQCGPHKRMTEILANKYKETPKANGTVSRKRLMQAFVSDGGSWTIVITTADGNSCIIAAGQNWEDVLHEPGPRI